MREVAFEEAVALVQQCDLRSFVETSAANGQGVIAAMQTALTGKRRSNKQINTRY